jgi:hypothetical protein
MTTRKELIEALRERYRSAAFGDRIKILDEFVALTGYHRKHAIRILHAEVATATGARTQSSLRRGGAPGADRVVGSGRSGLRQASEGVDPDVGRCHGASRSSRLRATLIKSTACTPPALTAP